MTGTRRKARSTALQTLYEIDTVRRDADAVVERLLAEVCWLLALISHNIEMKFL